MEKQLFCGKKCKERYLKQMKKHRKEKTKVYISGAISKDPNHFLNFENAERILRENGFEPLNPCKTPEYKAGKSDYECLIAALRLLLESGVMVQISNIKISLGMSIEQIVGALKGISVQNWILDQRRV